MTKQDTVSASTPLQTDRPQEETDRTEVEEDDLSSTQPILHTQDEPAEDGTQDEEDWGTDDIVIRKEAENNKRFNDTLICWKYPPHHKANIVLTANYIGETTDIESFCCPGLAGSTKKCNDYSTKELALRWKKLGKPPIKSSPRNKKETSTWDQYKENKEATDVANKTRTRAAKETRSANATVLVAQPPPSAPVYIGDNDDQTKMLMKMIQQTQETNRLLQSQIQEERRVRTADQVINAAKLEKLFGRQTETAENAGSKPMVGLKHSKERAGDSNLDRGRRSAGDDRYRPTRGDDTRYNHREQQTSARTRSPSPEPRHRLHTDRREQYAGDQHQTYARQSYKVEARAGSHIHRDRPTFQPTQWRRKYPQLPPPTLPRPQLRPAIETPHLAPPQETQKEDNETARRIRGEEEQAKWEAANKRIENLERCLQEERLHRERENSKPVERVAAPVPMYQPYLVPQQTPYSMSPHINVMTPQAMMGMGNPLQQGLPMQTAESYQTPYFDSYNGRPY